MIRKRISLGRYVDGAAKGSAFTPTEFYIYDKSTQTKCDRLIVVRPFDWYIWAIGDQLYILNPEGGILCGAGSTPAVKVLKDQFIEVCLKIDYDSILRGYTEGVPPSKVVPYEIESTTFTILSALNLLVKEYITFASTVKRSAAHRIKTIDDDDEGGEDDDKRSKRSITAQTVERMMSKSKIGHPQLLEQYRYHMPKNQQQQHQE